MRGAFVLVLCTRAGGKAASANQTGEAASRRERRLRRGLVPHRADLAAGGEFTHDQVVEEASGEVCEGARCVWREC